MSLRALTILGAALTSLVAGQEAPRSSPSFTDSQSFLEAQLRPLRPLSPAATRRVRDLLSQMTLKEKVGQMTQLEIGMIADGQEGSLRVNPDKLRKAVIEYGVGSILNVKDVALPPAKWHEIIGAIAKAADQTRLKIPVIYGLDSVHGANYVAGATIFPQALGMASTWDFELMLEASSLAAAETRSVGVPWNFSPVLDVGRQQQWPRLYETLGEDPYLATVLGVAAVRGYQGDDPSSAGHAAATLKHYIGYSVPISGHDRTPALIPDITMRDTLLPPFAAAVKAGALTVMVNSGEVNGIPGHVNKRLLNDVLRGELGFDGVIVSDWEDIKKLVKMHHTAANEKEATRAAILAGIDMSMVPSDYSFSDLLVQLVNEGAVPMSRIDDAVGRILTLKARVGLLDSSDGAPATAITVGSAASRQVALRAARESIVLAKNAPGVLPLSPSARVLLTGPTADSQVSLNNGWTITWLGDRASLYPADRPTVRRALEARLGARLTYVPGASYDKAIDVQAAATAASSADVVILCLGEMSLRGDPRQHRRPPVARCPASAGGGGAGRRKAGHPPDDRGTPANHSHHRRSRGRDCHRAQSWNGRRHRDRGHPVRRDQSKRPSADHLSALSKRVVHLRLQGLRRSRPHRGFDDVQAAIRFRFGLQLYDLRIRRPQHGQQGYDVRSGHRRVGHGPQHGETGGH